MRFEVAVTERVHPNDLEIICPERGLKVRFEVLQTDEPDELVAIIANERYLVNFNKLIKYLESGKSLGDTP